MLQGMQVHMPVQPGMDTDMHLMPGVNPSFNLVLKVGALATSSVDDVFYCSLQVCSSCQHTAI